MALGGDEYVVDPWEAIAFYRENQGQASPVDEALAQYLRNAGQPVDYEAIIRASTQGGIDQTLAAAQIAKEMAQRNLDLVSSDLTMELALSAGEDASLINAWTRSAIEQDVNALLGPGGMDALMGQVGDANADVVDVVNTYLPSIRDTVSDYLEGKIPGDVTEQVLMRGSEDVLRRFGRTSGPASEGLVARDLGLTSMDIKNMGVSMAPGVAQFAGLPIQSAADVTNVISQYRTPLANMGAMQQNYLSAALGGAMINPNTTLQTAAQTQASNLGVASQIAMGNQQAAYASATSMLNFQADRYAADLALEGAEIGASATRSAGRDAMWGGIIGEIFG